MKNIILAFSCCLSFMASAVYAEPKQNLNDIGYQYYKAGQYWEAIDSFEAAIKENPKSALPHYNLACTLSLLNEKEYHGDDGSLVKRCLTHLKEAIALSENRKKRALEDKDFNSVRGTVYFRFLANKLDLNSADQVTEILKHTHWTSENQCGGGLFDDSLIFLDSGQVRSGCGNYCFDAYEEKCTMASGYQVSGASVTLVEPKQSITSLRISFDGLEAKIEGVDQTGKSVQVWYEYSGYHGSP